MPYIPQDHRQKLARAKLALAELILDLPERKRDGAVVYAMCELVLRTLKPEGGWDWKALKDARACFQEAHDEFGRRLTGPYEDGAIERNGDLPGFGGSL